MSEQDIVERLNYCGGRTDAQFVHVPSRAALLLEAAAEITTLRDEIAELRAQYDDREEAAALRVEIDDVRARLAKAEAQAETLQRDLDTTRLRQVLAEARVGELEAGLWALIYDVNEEGWHSFGRMGITQRARSLLNAGESPVGAHAHTNVLATETPLSGRGQPAPVDPLECEHPKFGPYEPGLGRACLVCGAYGK